MNGTSIGIATRRLRVSGYFLVATSLAVAAGVAFAIAVPYLSQPEAPPRLNYFVAYRPITPKLGLGKLFSGKILTFAVLFPGLWVGVAALSRRWHRRSLTESLTRFPHYFLPLLPLIPLLAVRPTLLAQPGVDYNLFVFGFVIALASSLALVAGFIELEPRWPQLASGAARVSTQIVALGIAGYALLFSALSVLKVEALNSHTFDLAQFDQVLWNTAHGRPLASSFLRHNYLFEHFSPTLVPLSALYLVWSDVRALLVFQSAFLALGALPLYWLAREKVQHPLAHIAIPLAYLLYVPLHGVNLDDFHEMSLAPTALLFAWYFLQRGRAGLGVVWLALAAGSKEEVLLISTAIGAYLLVRGRRKALGGSIATVSLLLFVAYLALRSMLPSSPLGDTYRFPLDRYFPFHSPSSAFSGPVLSLKLQMLLFFFAPVMFLPFASGLRAILMAVPLAGLLASHSQYLFVPTTHYSASVVPLIFISAVHGFATVEARSRFDGRPAARSGFPAFCVTYILACTILLTYFFGQLPWSRAFHPDVYEVTTHSRLVAAFKRMIPENASLSVNIWLAPHFSQRQRLYALGYGDFSDPEYLLTDLRNYKPLEEPVIRGVIAHGTYGAVACADGITLLRRGRPSDPGCLAAVNAELR